ncbi:MAG: hypothetical protein H5T66_01810 [Chloroflexi bacterium]|nr:hypothetical protein [Chloroflexota bacterium]
MPVDPFEIFHILFRTYGPQHWWPGETPFEIIVGAVLTQNTAWNNVSRAIANLKEAHLLALDALQAAEADTVLPLISPSGFYHVKYRRLKALLGYLNRPGSWEYLQTAPVEEARAQLLSIHGIGPETADSILLYAFDRPTFVVDAYTRRLFARLGEDWMEKAPYEAVRRYFMERLPLDIPLYNEFHALIVAHGKVHCRKRPNCQGCPLAHDCATQRASALCV